MQISEEKKAKHCLRGLLAVKMQDFIYRTVNMSLIATGFLGFNSATGHLISHLDRAGSMHFVFNNGAFFTWHCWISDVSFSSS